MATPKQELTISYGAFIISDASKDSYILNELDWRVDYSRLQATIQFKVIVKGTTDGEVNSRCNSLQEVFRGRRDTLTISVNGNTYRSFSSTNKEVVSTITLLDDELFTKYTRRFQINIVADLDPPDGEIRTIQSVVLSYAPNRVRTIQIVIDYHSTDSNSAKDNYESDTAIWGTLLATWAGGSTTWWLPEETVDGDIDLGNKLTVSRTYTEKIKKAAVTYGDLTVGGSSTKYDLVNGWSFQAGRLEGTVSFVVRVSSSSASSLASDCNDLEEAFRKRQVSLELTYDSVSQREFVGDDIYLNSRSTATALDNEWFGTKQPGTTTGETYPYTRDYQVSITIDMPPNDGTDGRTEEDVTINEDPSGILTVTISAKYNSIEGTEAGDLLAADFDTYAELVKTRIGISLWEQVGSTITEVPIDVSGTLTSVEVRKTATFREIHYTSPGLATIGNDTNITDFVLNFSISKKYPGDSLYTQFEREIEGTCLSNEREFIALSSSGGRLSDINISFSYFYKKTSVTSISTYYLNVVRPLILVYMKSILDTDYNTSVISIVDDTTNFSEAKNNTVSGTILAQGLSTLSLYGNVTATVNDVFGKIVSNVYDGKPHSKIVDQGEATRTRVITGTVTTAIQGDEISLPIIAPKPMNIFDEGWLTLSYRESQHPLVFGDPLAIGENFEVMEYSFEENQIWIEAADTQIFTPGGTP